MIINHGNSQTIFLNSDNISNDGTLDPNYVIPNKTGDGPIGSINGTVLA